MKAVIPAAGLGTRFLPATKAQPKEMLPVVDKPTIQYVIEEAVASGIDDILIVTGRGKRAIEDHFDRSIELETHLEQKNDQEFLDELLRLADLADIHYIRQKEAKGLGHAIFCARKHIGNEPFAVLLGDTITLTETPCTKRLWQIFKEYKASAIAVEEVPWEKVSQYGIIKGRKVAGDIFLVEDLIEKPSREKAFSNLAIFGRYVLTPTIFECLKKTKPGKGGEIQLTDALKLLLEKESIYAYEVKGRRYDIGKKIDWLIANIELALDRPDLRPSLIKYLRKIQKEN